MKNNKIATMKTIFLSSFLIVTSLASTGAHAYLDMLCRKTYIGGSFNNSTVECQFTWSSLDELTFPDGMQDTLALDSNAVPYAGSFQFNAPSQPYNEFSPWLNWTTPGVYAVESEGNLSFSWVSGENPNIVETIWVQDVHEFDAGIFTVP